MQKRNCHLNATRTDRPNTLGDRVTIATVVNGGLMMCVFTAFINEKKSIDVLSAGVTKKKNPGIRKYRTWHRKRHFTSHLHPLFLILTVPVYYCRLLMDLDRSSQMIEFLFYYGKALEVETHLF